MTRKKWLKVTISALTVATWSAVSGLTPGVLATANPSDQSAGQSQILKLEMNQIPIRNSGASDIAATAVTAGGGTLRIVTGLPGQGQALSMPAFAAQGPRAVLDVRPRSGDPLSPGTNRFEVAADITIDDGPTGSSAAGSTDNGNNIVQRGLFNGPSQYKIQADNRIPSCRILGDQGDVLVTANTTLATDKWYRLSCTRDATRVTLAVTALLPDGRAEAARTWVATGATGSIKAAPSVPLSVGGKLTGSGRLATQIDQFNGRIDNISFTVG